MPLNGPEEIDNREGGGVLKPYEHPSFLYGSPPLRGANVMQWFLGCQRPSHVV